MSITTVITEKCDGCGDIRDLSHEDHAENGGWVEVKHNQHLCPLCITMALNKNSVDNDLAVVYHYGTK